MKTLGWGLGRAVPQDAVSAWGCRAIVDQDGLFDLVPDRQDWQGGTEVLEVLTSEFPLPELIATVGDLLRSRIMDTRQQETFVLYQGRVPAGQLDHRLQRRPVLTVVADTNASAGYCYVAAWVTAATDLPDGWWRLVPCPRCHSTARRCRRPSGHEAAEWHRDRWRAARAAFPGHDWGD